MSIPRLTTLAPDFTRFDLGRATVWFSFETPIAFEVRHSDGTSTTVVRQNDWSAKTGRHLNQVLRDNGKRVDSETFEHLFYTEVGTLG